MDDITARIVSDLETQLPVSQSFLKDLQTLLIYTLDTNDSIDLENLYSELSSRNLSLNSLANAVSSAMDSGLSLSTSLLASKDYLLLLLAPNSPVFTIFTPVSFLSLLRIIRLAVKNPVGIPSREKKNHGKLRRVESRDRSENESEENGFDVNDLFFVLNKLEMVLGLVHLDRFPDCLKSLVQTLCEIPTNAVEFSGNLSGSCLKILTAVMKSEHGNVGDTAAEVLKGLTPLILLPKSPARSFGLSFVLNKIMLMGKSLSDIKRAVANLPKYLVQKAPERAEPRAMAVESAMEIVKALDLDDQVEFNDYVVKMSLGKGQFRLLPVDMIPVLITSQKGQSGVKLLEVLIQRCSDSTAGIRAKALTNLANLMVNFSGNNESLAALKEVVGNNGMKDLLKKRWMDEKAAVRKASLLLISKKTALLGEEFDEELLKTVGMACSDPLVSIRKVAISALSEAFRTHSNDLVTKEWLHSIPRLIADNETSIQEECENLFSELVLDRISLSENLNIVLELLKQICYNEVSLWVKKLCSSLGKKKRLKPRIAMSLKNIIKNSETQWSNRSMPIEKWTAPPGAWFLLSEISAFLVKEIEWEFLQHHLQHLEKYNKPEEGDADVAVDVDSHSVSWVGDRVFLLQTISNVSVELPPEPAADLAHNFLERLKGFNMHPTEVNAHVKALRTLCKRKAQNPDEADSLVMRLTNEINSKASEILDNYMSKTSNPNKNSVFLTPQACGTQRGTKKTSKLLSQAVIAVYTIGSLVIVCPSADLKNIVPAIHTIITSGSKSSELLPVPAVQVKQSAPSLYIQAWLTMGKICLADGKMAKRYLPLFVQELENSDCAALRNNIVVMMADFCVRYTAMVDCYMSKITKCLRDPCEPVRRQTFILLSRLLQRDYVKWRGVLFLRFLLCLVDDSEQIRQQADFLFGNILKAKAPLLAYNSFVEAIFVLNDCNAHTGRSNPNSSRSENNLFSIRGNDEKSRSQRLHIYVTLLKQMSPEHLLATFAKVCAEILAAASDGMLSLEDSAGQSVLQDAFLVLSSKEIRIQSNRNSSSSESAEIEEDGAENNSSAAKGRAVTQAVKKGLIQNMIPIFIELKRLLESKKSPAIGSLMECLRILLKDYKNEIDDILVADKQLQKELIYDMQKYELMKNKSTATEAVAQTINRADTYFSPRGQNVSAVKGKLPENFCSNSKVAAAANIQSVLREVNRGAGTPVGSIGIAKLKSRTGGGGGNVGFVPKEVIESVRRRQEFGSDDES